MIRERITLDGSDGITATMARRPFSDELDQEDRVEVYVGEHLVLDLPVSLADQLVDAVVDAQALPVLSR
jgi:hypothetical protein